MRKTAGAGWGCRFLVSVNLSRSPRPTRTAKRSIGSQGDSIPREASPSRKGYCPGRKNRGKRKRGFAVGTGENRGTGNDRRGAILRPQNRHRRVGARRLHGGHGERAAGRRTGLAA